VLLPQQWVGGDGEELVVVVLAQRTQLDEVADEMGLRVERLDRSYVVGSSAYFVYSAAAVSTPCSK
jgi:hypothetical protein